MSIDVICLIIVASGCAVGYRLGILQGLFMGIVVVFGLVGAMWFTPVINETLKNALHLEYRFLPAVSFLLTLAGSVLIIRLLGMALQESFNTEHLSMINRYGGAALMGFFFMILGSALIKFADEGALIPERVKKQSYSFKIVRTLPERSYKAIRGTLPIIKDFSDYVKREVWGIQPDSAYLNLPEPEEDYIVPDPTPNTVPKTEEEVVVPDTLEG